MNTVFVWRLLFTNPMMAIALCICLATLFWCIAVLHRRDKGPDRFLAALIGGICVVQGMRLLNQAGVIALTGSLGLNSFAELMITGLLLIAMLILRISAMERKSTEVRLRLAEADDPKRIGPILSLDSADHSIPEIILGSNPLATIALDNSGTVIYWNSAAERILGWHADEVVGKPSPLPLNGPLSTKGGAPLRLESWVSTIRDSAGRACGTVHMLAPASLAEPSPALACDAPALAC